MNKVFIVFPIVILVLLASAWYVNSVGSKSSNISSESQSESGTEISASTLKSAVPEGAYSYTITQGSTASYIALKKFISKPEGYVTGVSEQVEGQGWFNPSDGTGFVHAIVDVSTVKTDSEKRDKDVLDMFSEKTVRFSADISTADLALDQNFEVEVPGQLTFNGITKEVIFRVNGSVSESQLSAEGSTIIKMSDFGLTPPSLVNVFTADDNLELKFDIRAERTN